MIRKMLWGLVLVGYALLVWYGATGETGPMGWLNALQQHWTGGYSRKLSFMVFCFAAIVVTSPILLPLVLTAPPRQPPRARPPASSATAAPGEVAATPVSGWRTALLAWAIPVALAWIGTFGYHAWDWHLRSQDATEPYQPVSLARSAPEEAVATGSHLALPGRFLWDRAIVRHERGNSQPESTFVPVVDRAWRAGEPVRFVARFDSKGVQGWRMTAGSGQRQILARVDGAVPTAAFDVFAEAGAVLSPAAALIVAVAADGQPAQIAAAFDVENALLLASILTVVWTLSLLAIGLAIAKERWSRRRRAGKAAPATAGKRNWVWIGGGYDRK